MNNKYHNGKIYKLICDDLTYYGSTTEKYLSSRLAKHKYQYEHQYNVSTMSKKLFETQNDVNIILVEDYPCERKEQLLARERYYIDNFNCVNKTLPLRTQKEYYNSNKAIVLQNVKNYTRENIDKVKAYKKEHYEANKEKKKEYDRNYRQENQQRIKEYMKQYREKQKSTE